MPTGHHNSPRGPKPKSGARGEKRKKFGLYLSEGHLEALERWREEGGHRTRQEALIAMIVDRLAAEEI